MNRHIPIALIYLIIFIASSKTFSQLYEYKFDHLSTEDGLSQSAVTAIYQDKKGFMWFGTQDGLNKYDGYNFTIFKYVPFDSTSLSDNWIQAISEDENGNLWIGTFSGGIFEFNTDKQIFTNYRNNPANKNSLANNRVWAIYPESPNLIWIGTSSGLDKFDKSSNSFTHFKNKKGDENSLSNNAVNAIYKDKNGFLWIGTWGGGLNKFDETKLIFDNYNFGKSGTKQFGYNFVKTICDDGDYLLLGTSRGLIKFNRIDNNFSILNLNEDNNDQFSVLSILKDSKGQIWIGTHHKGLYLLNINDKVSEKFINDISNIESISDNWISAIYQDRNGVLWFGTGKGVDKLSPFSKYFVHYEEKPGEPNTLSGKEVNAVFEDHEGLIWIGTWEGGLNRFDINKNKFSYYKHSSADPYSIPNNIVWQIYEDKSNTLWVGTYSGLRIFDRKRMKFINPPFQINLKYNNISSLFEDTRGYLWIGTWGGGVYKYNKVNKELTNFANVTTDSTSISDNLITAIYEDSKSRLWIGTSSGGLNYYDYEQNKFTRHLYNPRNKQSLSNNHVTAILEDKNKNLWLGTWGGGIDLFNPDNKTFKHLTEENKLSNNVVYGLLEDDNNFLWISTSKGLSRMDLANFSIMNYDFKDGLGNDQFSHGFFKCKNGNMIFGSINGFTLFNPDSIKIDTCKLKVVITSFKIFNREIKLPHQISKVERINLNYYQHDISLGFSALDFLRPGKNRYAYRLVGYDKDWIYLDKRRNVYYTNLEPGNYTFKVKAANGNNIWSQNVTSLSINITPPFWKTWPFIAFLTSLFLIIIFLIHKYRLEQLLKFERIRSSIAIDLHDDIGASLTRISLFSGNALRILEKFRSKKEDIDGLNKIESLLNEIGNDSRNLIGSMSDIVWTVNPQNDSFDNITIRMKDYTSKLMELKDIDYDIIIEHDLSSLSLPMDFRRNLFMIYKEGISNIIKHANATKVEIKLSRERNKLVLSMKDNGKGFDVKASRSGNGLKNIKERALSFNGSSNFTSSPNKGTLLKVELKLP